MKIAKILKNRLEELSRASHLLREVVAEHKIVSEDLFDCLVSVEEVLMNIITHGYRDDLEHEIDFKISLEEDLLTIQIIDDGISFNPINAPRPNIDQDIKDRSGNGLGIHLVKKLMDKIKYERIDNKNCLTIKKRISFKK